MSAMELVIHLLLLVFGSIKARCASFDYVIAGAGTSGLVLANRLSEDPNVRVAVIEPGHDVRNNPNVTDVGAFLRAFDTDIDWQYTTTPQPGGNNKSIPFHAGKAIGGTSTINGKDRIAKFLRLCSITNRPGMTYIRGDKAQFDIWDSLGNDGWNWDALYPYMKKIEKFSPPTTAQLAAGASFDPQYHGEDGLVKTGYPFRLINGTLHGLAQQAWDILGYPLNPDVNGGEVRGFSVWPQTLDRDANIREDAARAYYYPIEKRPNLEIIEGTVTKITWTSSLPSGGALVADGVEYQAPDGQIAAIAATKEVILSAGALRSPLILERSGVGNHR